MTFECVSWRFNVGPSDARETLCAKLRALACECLNLCASVGCACVTGVGEQVCYEADTGGKLPAYQSQGPHWSVNVIMLPETVILTVFFEAPVVPDEIREMHSRLVTERFPVFYSMYHAGTRF